MFERIEDVWQEEVPPQLNQDDQEEEPWAAHPVDPQEDVSKQVVNQADPVVVAPPEKVRFDFDCNSVHPKLMPGQPAQNCHELGSQKLVQKLCT